nr:hypothetical protein [Escherichia coli]
MELSSIKKMRTQKGSPSLSRIALDTCKQWAEKDRLAKYDKSSCGDVSGAKEEG